MAKDYSHLLIKFTRRCHANECGAEIDMRVLPNGKLVPCDKDGQSHFITCAQPDRFSGRGKRLDERAEQK